MEYDHRANYIFGCIEKDPYLMEILRVAKKINLPDWWLTGSFVRNKIWDTLHQYEQSSLRHAIDAELIYFNNKNLYEEADKKYELELYMSMPEVVWSVKNAARIHEIFGDKPYINSADAISRWPETATCVGVRLNKDEQLELAAPLGLEDLTRLILRPNKNCRDNPDIFFERLHKKNWQGRWPKLVLESRE